VVVIVAVSDVDGSRGDVSRPRARSDDDNRRAWCINDGRPGDDDGWGWGDVDGLGGWAIVAASEGDAAKDGAENAVVVAGVVRIGCIHGTRYSGRDRAQWGVDRSSSTVMERKLSLITAWMSASAFLACLSFK